MKIRRGWSLSGMEPIFVADVILDQGKVEKSFVDENRRTRQCRSIQDILQELRTFKYSRQDHPTLRDHYSARLRCVQRRGRLYCGIG